MSVTIRERFPWVSSGLSQFLTVTPGCGDDAATTGQGGEPGMNGEPGKDGAPGQDGAGG